MPRLINFLTSILASKKSYKNKHRQILVGKKSGDDSPRYPSNRITTSKYTLWNFLPKNLFEQFHRIANLYFLIVVVISYFVDTSVSVWATLLPLLFVVSATAAKQGYEDWLRHRSDNRMNSLKCSVIREGLDMEIKTSDIEVGDIIRVERDGDIPCDMVMLSSSEPDGSCYITTTNLDGESNLKTYNSPSETSPIPVKTLKALIECEHPTMDLYKFNGSIFVKSTNTSVLTEDRDWKDSGKSKIITNQRFSSNLEKPICLTATNLLLRGTRLKNTDYVYGCAVYTGHETKISLNTIPQERKMSTVEKKLNRFLIFYIVILVVASFLWMVWAFLFDKNYEKQDFWYLARLPEFDISLATQELFVFMVLFNYILPISMYVTIEVQKFCGSIFFEWDLDMYDPSDDEHAKANTSDLNEELGQIQYLFTDKTGTLTENKMLFRKIYVGGNCYREIEGVGLVLMKGDEDESVSGEMDFTENPIPTYVEGKLEDVLICLALCHTVRMDHFSQAKDERCQHIYQSASPDEKALVEACARLGIIYLGTESGHIRLSIVRKKPLDALTHTPDNLSDYNKNHSDEENIEDTNSPNRFTEYKTYDLKHVLEFDSDRRKMSVIVEELHLCDDDDDDDNISRKLEKNSCIPKYNISSSDFPEINDCPGSRKKNFSEIDLTSFENICQSRVHSQKFKGCGRYKVICKGADTAVTKDAKGDVKGVRDGVNKFAGEGYRTLVVASKEIDEKEFKSYDNMLHDAKTSLDKREAKLSEVYSLIETQLEVLGATAVEDKLQDQVYETIDALRKAGIKVWVLTGDKEETALNVSLSAGHITKDMINLILNGQDKNECKKNLFACINRFNEAMNTKYALIISGETLSIILTDEIMSRSFCLLCQKCVAVLCCRLSPIQKATVVKMIKESKDRPITAAVGDGANDVNMILEAHVGIGIIGKEGRQASRSSDFALPKFKHLRKAILIHGHYFYVRLAVLVLYFFFKNVAMTCVQVFYTVFSAFSAQTFFGSFYLTFYNTTFTALPIVLYGIFEKHLREDVLMAKPSLYRCIRNNKMLDVINFTKWNILGVWHSFVYFFGTYGAIQMGSSFFYDGWDLGIFDAGAISMTVCVISVNLKLAIESYMFNWMIIGGFVVSILGYYALTLLTCSILIPRFQESVVNHGSLNTLMKSGSVWLLKLLMTTAAILPDLVLRVGRNTFHVLYSSPVKLEGERERMEEDSYAEPYSISLISLKSECSSVLSLNADTALGFTSPRLSQYVETSLSSKRDHLPNCVKTSDWLGTEPRRSSKLESPRVSANTRDQPRF